VSNVKAHKPSNQLRIIGGQWRSRKLQFPDIEGLRPTPDRVRETLFNWLQPVIHGARCLDLFAGSGALGLEALSRGAGEVVMVDRDPQVIASLRKHIDTWQAQGARVVQTDALNYLQTEIPQTAFDIVFLDPPFRHNLLEPCCQWLAYHPWLAPNARVYLEAESELQLSVLPENWRITHSKCAGEVGYYLAVRE
jgi:16S rRNA (guanine966-N2)-methyltransferase